ncbi:MAG: esterase family protein [Microscillaceae bacterium]|nr:esterase family protein [Microscillaceae bacterium]MDW8461126.1 alpha/beta hydrolase-fold protein [Cytophagales bacterium]
MLVLSFITILSSFYFFKKANTLSMLPQIEAKLYSKYLRRSVKYTIILPYNYERNLQEKYPVLYLNDGQDLEKLQMQTVLQKLYTEKAIPPLILVAIHANKNRIQEYGTASQPDYAKRGAKAYLYTQFILKELVPTIQKKYRSYTEPEYNFFAGFSLGGLSAIDIVWANPHKFSKVGVFSGSLWWRSKPYEEGYEEDKDRIMHQIIRKSEHKPKLKFWFQAGTEDETEDRNNNGVIDAIDDTLDLMKELEKKGYQRDIDFTYLEVQGGKHDPQTWGQAMPFFLKWLFEK